MEKYKYSRYNITSQIDNGNYLLYNTKSGYLIMLDQDNFDAFHNLDDVSDVDSIQSLSKCGYIVNADTDELNELMFHNKKTRFNSTELDLTIQTTNYCNFACPYCYQTPTEIKLTKDTIETLKRFIYQQVVKGDIKKIAIHWFGGEPLMNYDAILEVEAYIKEMQQQFLYLTYQSSITTNGYLLNRKIFELIATNTSIDCVQITLDGPKDIHDRTRILKNNNGTFEVIIKNLKDNLAFDSKIKFLLRTNLNTENVVYAKEYLDELEKENILHHPRVDILFRQVHNFDHRNEENTYFWSSKTMYAEKIIEIYKMMLNYQLTLPRYTPLSFSHCSFDNINTYLIAPDLKIYTCSAAENKATYEVGHIKEDGTLELSDKYYKRMSRDIFKKEKCINCVFLPICYGGCHYLESSNHDECIPEKYVFTELLTLYQKESNRGDVNV